LRHALKPVVPNGGRGPQSFLKIPRLNEISIMLRMITPDTCQTVSL
jgi:hypothetical protein